MEELTFEDNAYEGETKYEIIDGIECGKLAYEIIEGVKFNMSPAPTPIHGTIIGRIVTIFTNYILEHDIEAAVFGDNTDVIFSEEHRFKPDVSVVLNTNIISWHKAVMGTPDLIVEVLSESTMKNDLGKKKDIYEKYGVKEYWIVDPWTKRIDVYHLVEGKFQFYDVCKYHSKCEAGVETSQNIKVSIFEDLTVDISKIFKWRFGAIQ